MHILPLNKLFLLLRSKYINDIETEFHDINIYVHFKILFLLHIHKSVTEWTVQELSQKELIKRKTHNIVFRR